MSDPGGLSILRTVGGLLATKRFTWQPVAQVWLRSTIPKVSLLMRYRSYCRHVFRMSGASGNYHRPPDLSVVFLKLIFSTG